MVSLWPNFLRFFFVSPFSPYLVKYSQEKKTNIRSFVIGQHFGFQCFRRSFDFVSMSCCWHHMSFTHQFSFWNWTFHLSCKLKLKISRKLYQTSMVKVQSNLDYPYLDYPDFSIIQSFSLVPILSWIFISHDQDPYQYSF